MHLKQTVLSKLNKI